MMLFASILTLLGSIFLFLGGLGIWRMPDVYNRMQAGTKATTLGTLLFLVGLMIRTGDSSFVYRLILLAAFVMMTNPISSHVLARAAQFTGIANVSRRDDLSDLEVK